MTTVFVSGCYDILHGGHVEFFSRAKAFGDRLVVCVAGDKSLWAHKQRKPSIPIEHKVRLIQSLSMVDEVVVGECEELGLDFKEHFRRIRPDLLVVTDDDRYAAAKRQLCESVGSQYVVVPKTLDYQRVSSTEIVRFIQAPREVPLRVDFAGGWLDVPRLARPGGYIVNCAISPLVSLSCWPYKLGAGLGGSAAYATLTGKNALETELDMGVGWQDPAIIRETGLCAWRSGPQPVLEIKSNPEFLRGRMGLIWTGQSHCTPDNTGRSRDYDAIWKAGRVACDGVRNRDFGALVEAVRMSYAVQLGEGMDPVSDVPGAVAIKYCGGGWGGYVLCLFDAVHSGADGPVGDPRTADPRIIVVEPYLACGSVPHD